MSGGLCMCRNGCVCDTQQAWIELYSSRSNELLLEHMRMRARIETLESSLRGRRNALRQIARILREGAGRYRHRRKTMRWLVDELFVEAARADHDLSSDV